MARTIVSAAPRALGRLAALARWGALAALALILAAQLLFFGAHAAQLLRYPYPLDYGEGPLLAQVGQLRAGTPPWRLYADPDQPPYAVVNYPPVFHALVALASLLVGAPLLAGRLVSLTAALAAVVAFWLLTDTRPKKEDEGGVDEGFIKVRFRPSSLVGRLLIVLSFLAIPIVREWAVVMRVDMLGLALGLWALVIVRRGYGSSRLLWAALPLALSLLVKPSLLAAPGAALLWLLFRDWRRALLLGALTGLLGGLAVAGLQLGSGGWFWLHVVAANANPWQRALAYGFWHDQLLILWPLLAAGALGALGALSSARRAEPQSPIPNPRFSTLPLYYALLGALVAFGVGKVGAYANYFLEFYAGLIWLAGSATKDEKPRTKKDHASLLVFRPSSLVPVAVVLFVAAAQLRYYPTWSENYLKLAGIIEGRNPPRVVVGGYGLWRDLAREREILAAYRAINRALDAEVRAAGGPIFTDVPGVAAQSGQLARLQAFEYRQLIDAGLADQRGLLRELANGRVPLVALDYLGNWLSPEMIALITQRYAQDGSRGIYDLYRPVEPGPRSALQLEFDAGMRLLAFHLAPAPGGAYRPGELALLTLEWQATGARAGAEPYEVLVRLADERGGVQLEFTRPLLGGALPPNAWAGETIQHMQPLALPAELPAGTYHASLTLRQAGRELAPPRELAALVVGEPAGRVVGENGYYVPAPLLAEWRRLGGDEPAGPGDALTPAVPFAGYTLQCFARACLQLVEGQAERVPLGELVQLGDAGLRPAGSGEVVIGARFAAFWQAHGGEAVLGPPLSPELQRGDRVVQYTRYARLEQRLDGSVALARLGDEYLRLPGGVPYRWP